MKEYFLQEKMHNKIELLKTVDNIFTEFERLVYRLDRVGLVGEGLDKIEFNYKVLDQLILAKEMLVESISKQPDYQNENETKST